MTLKGQWSTPSGRGIAPSSSTSTGRPGVRDRARCSCTSTGEDGGRAIAAGRRGETRGLVSRILRAPHRRGLNRRRPGLPAQRRGSLPSAAGRRGRGCSLAAGARRRARYRQLGERTCGAPRPAVSSPPWPLSPGCRAGGRSCLLVCDHGLLGARPEATDSLRGAPARRADREHLDLAAEASPVSHVHGGAPPFLLQHGEADTWVPCDQSVRFADRLREPGWRSSWRSCLAPITSSRVRQTSRRSSSVPSIPPGTQSKCQRVTFWGNPLSVQA